MYCTLPAGYYCLNMFNLEYPVQWKSTQQFPEDYLKVNSLAEKQHFNFKVWNTFSCNSCKEIPHTPFSPTFILYIP